jgi:hypothetical protein
LFYESFALRLLDLGARAVIGPQIDIPTRFAEEYAKRFFNELLKRKDSKDPRLGHIVRACPRVLECGSQPVGSHLFAFQGCQLLHFLVRQKIEQLSHPLAPKKSWCCARPTPHPSPEKKSAIDLCGAS